MGQRDWARRRVPTLTAVLSAVALALVFGAALQVLPVEALPRRDGLLRAVPHVNVAVSLAAIATIGAGWASIRRGAVRRHRLLMYASVALFAAFLALYLYRVAILGPTTFGGPAAVRRFVYLPILAVHVVLAVVCVPLLVYVLLLATTRPVAEIYGTRHGTVGRVVAPLWIASFGLGVVVYALLHVLY